MGPLLTSSFLMSTLDHGPFRQQRWVSGAEDWPLKASHSSTPASTLPGDSRDWEGEGRLRSQTTQDQNLSSITLTREEFGALADTCGLHAGPRLQDLGQWCPWGSVLLGFIHPAFLGQRETTSQPRDLHQGLHPIGACFPFCKMSTIVTPKAC